jgi:hypothetical protein
MFNARDARALAQRATQTPAALLAAKTAIQDAAEAARFNVVASFPHPVRLAPGATSPGLSECIRLLKEQNQAAWAEVASQCNAAGYTVTPVREGGGASQFVVTGLALRWDNPRSAAPGTLVMSAEVAHRIAEQADRLSGWARPLLEEVERLAAAGRSTHVVRDPLASTAPAWRQRLEHLRGLGFEVELRSFGARSEVSLSW